VIDVNYYSWASSSLKQHFFVVTTHHQTIWSSCTKHPIFPAFLSLSLPKSSWAFWASSELVSSSSIYTHYHLCLSLSLKSTQFCELDDSSMIYCNISISISLSLSLRHLSSSLWLCVSISVVLAKGGWENSRAQEFNKREPDRRFYSQYASYSLPSYLPIYLPTYLPVAPTYLPTSVGLL